MSIVEILDKHVDQVGLAKDLMVELVAPKLKAWAAQTENKIDDKVVEEIIEFLSK
jgi:hypothetical protein